VRCEFDFDKIRNVLLQLPLNYIRSVLDRAFRIKIFDAKGIPNEYQRYLVFECRIRSSLLREKWDVNRRM